jgi:hypothetical protein
MLTIVARPIGKVPMKSDWAGCRIIAHHISGYTVYLTTEIKKNVINKTIFKQKIMTEIQYSQSPLNGKLWRRIETIPVPIVTENHLTCHM